MRIGFVSTYPPTHCGVGEYTRMLASAIRGVSPGDEVVVYSLYENTWDEWVDSEIGVRVAPSFMRAERSYKRLLDRLAEHNGVDVLHVQHEYGIFGKTPGILEALREARKERLAKRTVITMHTVVHPYSGRREELNVQLQLEDSVDAVVVHSFLQEFELQWQGVTPSKIYRIPHGTLVNPYLGHPRGKLAASLGIEASMLKGVVLAVPGFLRPDKGIDILLESMQILGSDDFTLIIAGEVRDNTIARMVEEAAETINIVFLERYLSGDEILRIVALADALILPYRDRKGSYAVSGILHLSMGGLKPIIGTKVPRLIELYQFAPRLTVPPHDPAALASRIKWLVHNYDYAVAYMATLYSYAARTQWPRMARRHIALYLHLLGEERRLEEPEPLPHIPE